MPSTPVQNFYAGKSVLITGATGFIGKVLVEKLLRSCPDIKCVYLLMRKKKGMTPGERIRTLTTTKVFENLKEVNPKAFNKVRLVSGDILEDELGLSNDDREELQNNCHVIFHSAACVRFDQKLKDAVELNTTGTLRMLQLAESMKNLEVLVHLSTAYCRCELSALEEKIYKAHHPPQKIMDMVNWMDDKLLTLIEPKLIDKEPNTYAYTKAITESLVDEYSHKFPIAIARPSIVIAALKEPIPGWIDNLNGPTGMIVGGGKGVIRTMHCEPSYLADMMPVDLVVNGCILAAYATALDKPHETRVFNVTLSGAVKMTWGEIITLGQKWVNEFPYEMALWYPGGTISGFMWVHKVFLLFTHWIPAYCVDFLLFLLGKKTFMVKLQGRIGHGLRVLQYYTTKEWNFLNDNFRGLRDRITEDDDKIFFTDVSTVNPDEYLKDYVYGARQYCVKEDPSTLPRAKRIHKIRYVADRFMKGTLLFLFLWFLYSYSYIIMNVIGFFDSTLTAISPLNSVKAEEFDNTLTGIPSLDSIRADLTDF